MTSDNTATATTEWTISCGEGYGGTPYRAGQVLRAQWWTTPTGVSVVDQVPGGWIVGDTGDQFQVSGIVVVADTTKLYYREDGLTFGVGDDEGHIYSALVRAATAEEAAPLLADEARARRRSALGARVRELVCWRYPRLDDANYNPNGDVSSLVFGLPQVPLRSEASADRHRGSLYPDELRADESSDTVWTLSYNGADGDDWSQSNCSSYIAMSFYLTAERQQMIEDLRVEYSGPDTWVEEDGYERAAAELLISVGWTRSELRSAIGALSMRTLADAREFLARSVEVWEVAGWRHRAVNASYGDVPATDAAQLADSGVTAERAGRLHHAGHTTLADKLAAIPPHVTGGDGLYSMGGKSVIGSAVTDHADQAQDWLNRNPESWQNWHHIPDLTCLHASTWWQLWSNGAITRGQWLPGSRPQLSEIAGQVLNLIATATPDTIKAVPRELRLRLTQATEHTDVTVLSSSIRHGGIELARHTVAVSDGEVVLWRVAVEVGGLSGGEGWSEEIYWIHDDERTARASYRQLKQEWSTSGK